MYPYKHISQAVVEGDAETTIKVVKDALAQKYPFDSILNKGLIAGMNLIAEKFREQRVVVPEVLMSSRAMHAGLFLLEPYFKIQTIRTTGRIIIGTVAGDLHDIGKNLVKMMVMTCGAEIVDLGIDVTAEKFSKEVSERKPDILMLSALLTTTMWNMNEVIEKLKAKGLRHTVKIIVGGAPVNEDFAQKIGADYYFEDAFDVKEFLDYNLAKIIKAKSV